MKKPELLLPAGNIEKLKYAIEYGADAVYLGVVDFSLRAMRKGELITLDNLKEAISRLFNLNEISMEGNPICDNEMAKYVVGSSLPCVSLGMPCKINKQTTTQQQIEEKIKNLPNAY